MSASESKSTARSPAVRNIEKEMEIAAPVEAVWKALTDAEELTRWFPLEVGVKPGVGGSIKLSWGPECEGEALITAWEPGRKFAWQEPSPFGGLGEGCLFVEWTLEARGGKTVVRLVHTGFAAGGNWDEEYFDSMDYGWGFMLTNLRLYLERHHGVARQVAWPRVKAPIAREEAWRRLSGASGLRGFPALDTLRSGERYVGALGPEDSLEGAVEFILPPRGFCLRIENWNDALLWLSIERPAGKSEIGFWLSAYGLDQRRVDEFGKRWKSELRRMFPEAEK